jgi:cobalt-zinc-cadmium efflux system membrane fusion protein
MKYPVHISKRIALVFVTTAAIVVAAGLLEFGLSRGRVTNANRPPSTPQGSGTNSNAAPSRTDLDLSPSQLSAIKIEQVGTYLFPIDKEAVGNISFADDLSVQVFPSYQGKIIKCLAELGDQVQKGQPLYTIESPDLIQAESNLIGAAATLDLTTKELARAKELDGNSGVSQREYEQAISDQQTAEGALKAARDAVRVFGKTDAEIDQMIASRKIDPALVVRSPISGEVTDFNGPEGLLVQPGNAPAPFTVSNVSIKWMLADVIESDIPLLHLGQSVQVKVMAYPDRVFDGKISEELSVLLPDEGTLWLSMTISSFWRMKSSSIGDFAATTYGSPGSGISECAKMTSL